jgi:endoglycosylceramidase
VPARLLALAVVALAAALLPAAPAGATSLRPLHAVPDPVHGGRIVDDRGREVLLRGVNVNSLGDYWRAGPIPPVLPFGAADARRIRQLGWNVVRLVVSWSQLEPEPGRDDPVYGARLAAVTRLLAARGIRTIVDLHQDAWSATLAARDGETCGGGRRPALGWDGAPAWATLDGGAPRCYLGARELSPAVQAAWAAFFADRPAADGVGIQTRYVAMLRRLARRVGRLDGVAGFDVMNEPGALGPGENAALGPFYRRALAAIRAGERAGRAQRHLVLVEPSVAWSLTGRGAPPAFPHDRDVVYAPHLYQGSIGAQGAPSARPFATARREAAALGGMPVLTGEWGGDPARAERSGDGYFTAHQALQDRFGIGATLWTLKQSCGDPHTILAEREGAAAATPPWSVFAMDCAGGANRVVAEHHALVDQLRRGYVRAAPGRLGRTGWTPRGRILQARGTGASRRDGPLEAFIPYAHARVETTGLGRARLRAIPGGGTLVTAAPRGRAWTVRVTPR